MKDVDYEACVRKTEDLLAKARMRVVAGGPYFSRLLYTLIPVLVPGYGTIGITNELQLIIDPVRIALDPELGSVDAKGIPQKLAGALVHELQHILRSMDRVAALASIDKELANIAADLPINEDVRAAGWELPTWGVFPEKYGYDKGLTMEQYFALLMKDAEEAKKKTRELVAAAKAADPKNANTPQPAGGLDVGAGQCGTAAGNGAPAPANSPAHTAPTRTPAEVEQARASTAAAANEYFSGPGRGNAPGWVEEAIAARKERDRDWVRELNHVVRRRTGIVLSGGSDFSLRRPSKRSLLRGIIRPGLVDQQVTAAFALDTSGSMGQDQLEKAKSIVIAILQQTNIEEVWLGQCDAIMQQPFVRTRLRDIPVMPIRGRSGTSFIPIFEALKTLKPKPDILIVLTDGDGPAPAMPPKGTAVIWCIVPSPWQHIPASWGHTIICSNDPKVVDKAKKRGAKAAATAGTP